MCPFLLSFSFFRLLTQIFFVSSSLTFISVGHSIDVSFSVNCHFSLDSDAPFSFMYRSVFVAICFQYVNVLSLYGSPWQI